MKKKKKKNFLLKKSKLEAKEQNWIWPFGGNFYFDQNYFVKKPLV